MAKSSKSQDFTPNILCSVHQHCLIFCFGFFYLALGYNHHVLLIINGSAGTNILCIQSVDLHFSGTASFLDLNRMLIQFLLNTL